MTRKPNEFHVTTTWTVTADLAEVATILTDATHLPDWWSEVYLDAEIIATGDEHGIGRQVSVRSKGALPYQMRWVGTLVESQQPHSWTIAASGDLDGIGVWSLKQAGAQVQAIYDWRVRAKKPILILLSPLLAPIFAWNHRWAMAKGEVGLKRELIRRRVQ